MSFSLWQEEIENQRKKLSANTHDWYCWECHKAGEVIACEFCPRVFHKKCAHSGTVINGKWKCPSCQVLYKSFWSLFCQSVVCSYICWLLTFTLLTKAPLVVSRQTYFRMGSIFFVLITVQDSRQYSPLQVPAILFFKNLKSD